eukprot:4976278-Ditylum_brightwellii.AAC.1
MRHSPSHRRINSKSCKRSSNFAQSWKINGHGQGQSQGQGGKGKCPHSNQENNKQGRAIAASVYKNMKTISKKKEEVGEVNLSKALIISLFKDEDVKKTIRAYVSSVEVAVKVSLPKDIVTQALSAPYVALKKPVNMAAALLCSLNLPVPRKGGT